MFGVGALNFASVDREEERAKIERFLAATDGPNILWMHGDRGCGKSHLAEIYCRSLDAECKTICVHQRDVTDKDYSYLLALIQSLEDAFEIGIMDYELIGFTSIRKHVCSVIETTAKTVVKPYFDPDYYRKKHTSISQDIGADKTRPSATSALLEKLIEDGLSVDNNICIVLDAFDECDNASFNAIARLLQNLNENPRVKIIAVTNDENTGAHKVLRLLQGFLNRELFKLSPFETSEPFFQILDDLTSPKTSRSMLRELSETLNQICYGKPAELWSVLDELVRAEKFSYSDSLCKFSFDYEVVSTFLEERKKRLEKPFSLMQFYQDCGVSSNVVAMKILKIIAIQSFSLSFDSEALFLTEVFNENLNIECSACDISQQLDLLFYSALREQSDGRVIFVNQSAEERIRKEAKDSTRDRFVYRSLYNVFDKALRTLPEDEGPFGLSRYESIKLLASYSFYARDDKWIEENVRALRASMNRDCFQESRTFSARLIDNCDIERLEADIIIDIAESFFRNGLYNEALPILVDFLDKTFEKVKTNPTKNLIGHAWYLRGCCEHSTLQLRQSTSSLDRALLLLPEGEREHYAALSAKISIMRAFPEHEQEAASLFFNSLEEYRSSGSMNCFYPLLKLAFFYCPEKESKALSHAGLQAALHYNDLAACNAFKINLGVLAVRSNDLEAAKNMFREAASSLSHSADHDIAYALNDEAVAYMFEGNFHKAHSLLLQAQYWSETNYALAAVGANRMMCELQISNTDAFCQIAKNNASLWLDDSNGSDPLTHRRMLINLSLGYFQLGQIDEAERYANRLRQCSSVPDKNSMSLYRYAYCRKMILCEDVELPTMPDESPYFTMTECEPFILLSCHS